VLRRPTRWSQTGLFSAAVASLISVSIQDIQENPQDTSNFYLVNIYQAIADPNSSNISGSAPASPPPFSPPNSAVWVNALWFLSLVVSLTCALLATLLQQWARRYLRITQSRYSPHKRARIRAFFAEGVEKCLLPWAVETLPTLLHTSLFLFFAGLVVFLCNVNLTIFKLVLSWVGLCTALYGCITCMPIIRHDSPYYTPLSLPAWHIVTRVLFTIYKFLQWFNYSVHNRYYAYLRFRDLEESCSRSLTQGMQKTAEETALGAPPEIDTRAFMWTFDCLDEDHELERFFSGLPGFRGSIVVRDPLPSLTEEEKRKLLKALHGLLHRTFSSDFLPALVKNRRAMVCAKAVDPEHTPNAFYVLDKILFKYGYSGPMATGILPVVSAWRTRSDEGAVVVTEATLCAIIARALPRDDSWFTLASSQLGVPEVVLRDYAAQGDNLSLLILIHVVRQRFIHFGKPSWPEYGFSHIILDAASNFNVKNTSPKLQHEFCALWNQIVCEMQDGYNQQMAFHILRQIRNVYLALHQDTDSAPTRFSTSTDDRDSPLWVPSSYPVCNVPGHCSDWTPRIHDDDVPATTARAIPPDPTYVPPVPREDSVFIPPPPSISDNESLIDALPFDNPISVPSSTRPVGQTKTEACRIPITSPSPVTACTMHTSTDPSLRTMQPSSSSPPPDSNVAASPINDVAVGHTALSCTPSGDINAMSSPSPVLVLDDMLPTGLLLFSGRDWI
jgi:hypothetical protein